MVDYNRGTGTAGTLTIRDDGWTVSFWISCSQSATFINGGTWSGVVNGVGVGGSFNLRGVQSVLLGQWGVGTNQTVSLTLNRTNTQGLGGPTSHSAWINRATAPPAPTPPRASVLGHDSLTAVFNSAGDGGTPVREWQLHYGPNGALGGAGNVTIGSSGTSPLTKLNLGTDYYFWARGRNDVGWSAWSGRGTAKTEAGCWIKVGGTWKRAVAYVKVNGKWVQGIPYVKVGGVWKDAK